MAPAFKRESQYIWIGAVKPEKNGFVVVFIVLVAPKFGGTGIKRFLNNCARESELLIGVRAQSPVVGPGAFRGGAVFAQKKFKVFGIFNSTF